MGEYKHANPPFGYRPNGKDVSVYVTHTKSIAYSAKTKQTVNNLRFFTIRFVSIKSIKGGARSWPSTISLHK
ncbi:hypothetical protein [Peribacillus simplex]|uniref:hypothetical protein n=1 Tax=Peribacillus simplex TaxID=1478 RepID=UPI003D2821F9